jgi:hypothetical protein
MKEEGDYLALCGDIGNPNLKSYLDLLRRSSERYTWVFVVAGNHEYYSANHTMEELKSSIRHKCALFENVTFLDDSSHIIGNTRFIGCTLWTDLSGASTSTSTITNVNADANVNSNWNLGSVGHYVGMIMNDYTKIKKKTYPHGDGLEYRRTKINPSDTWELHRKSVQFLQGEIIKSTSQGQKVVVLSHHAPTFQNIDPRYEGDPSRFAYASDLEYLIRDPILAWCHGHSHYRSTTLVNGVGVHCNPFGYRGEDTGYDENFYVKLM